MLLTIENTLQPYLHTIGGDIIHVYITLLITEQFSYPGFNLFLKFCVTISKHSMCFSYHQFKNISLITFKFDSLLTIIV